MTVGEVGVEIDSRSTAHEHGSVPCSAMDIPEAAADTHADATESRSIITRLAVLASTRWVVTLGVWLAVVAIGGLAYVGGLAREGFPPVNLPIVVVDGTYFVDDIDSVDADVARPLEEAYSAIDGVVEVQSFALANAFAVVVEFDDSFSSPDGAALLEEANLTASVAPEADVNVRPIDATKFLEVFDILVAVTGPEGATPEELEAQAAKVEAFLVDADAIERADVQELFTAGVDPATGDEQIRRTRFGRVALSPESGYQEAAIIGLVRSEAANLDTITFSDAVADRLAEDAGLDDGFEANVTADFATAIRTQVSSLTGNLLTGLLAVAFVSLILIGWRAAVVTGLFMATVMLASLGALWFLGYSLNTITLFGLILTLGLLVDDAIVISESIDANRNASKDPLGVVRTAINRVGSASLAGTLTTVLVFGPMLFVSGVLGEFIRAIPATVIITLLLSYLFSVIFITAVARPFLLKGSSASNPITKAEKFIGRKLGQLAEYPSSHGAKGLVVGAVVAVGALAVVVSSFSIAGSLGFNIFPPGDDADALSIDIDFEPGTSIEQAQTLSAEVDDVVLTTLGDDLLRSQYIVGNERGVLTYVDLVPFDTRDTKAPVYVEQMEEAFASIEGARITVGTLENGPPVDEFPFAAQIKVSEDQVEAAEELAVDLREMLIGRELDKATGESTTITDARISTEGQILRVDGEREIEVRAAFSNDDLTNNLTATEDFVTSEFDAAELERRGLPADSLGFDYGQESDNQEDFASLGVALIVALGLMLLLLVVQFRSLVQPLLILLAIPFSFFGVFSALSLTGNPISFFVAVGFIALVGVVVNNTILLVDAANQGRRDGLRPGAAIQQAVERRFRPLVATTITTVVGLLPLALSDPFWEALSFTLIGGLISSTIVVLLAFPVFYLIIEKPRTWVRNTVRSRMGRPLI